MRLGRRVEDVAQPVDRDTRLVKILPDLRQPQDRLRHAPRQHVEGNQFADGQLAVDDLLCAEDKMAAVTSLLMSWMDWLAQLPRFETRKLART